MWLSKATKASAHLDYISTTSYNIAVGVPGKAANRLLIRCVELLEDCERRASLDLTSIDRHKGCCEGNQPSTMWVDEQQAVLGGKRKLAP